MTLVAEGAFFIVCAADGLLEVVSLAWLSCELQLLPHFGGLLHGEDDSLWREDVLMKNQVHSRVFLTCFSEPPRRTSCSCFKESCLILCRIFFLLPDLFSPPSAKMPVVFFSSFLKSKYLAVDFSP